MRQFKVGDTVQAFWDARITGEIVNLYTVTHKTMLVGGTLDSAYFCEVKMKNGRVIRLRLHDIFHVE